MRILLTAPWALCGTLSKVGAATLSKDGVPHQGAAGAEGSAGAAHDAAAATIIHPSISRAWVLTSHTQPAAQGRTIKAHDILVRLHDARAGLLVGRRLSGRQHPRTRTWSGAPPRAPPGTAPAEFLGRLRSKLSVLKCFRALQNEAWLL